MKDIAHRLRTMGSTEWLESGDSIVTVCREAAEEIERLTREIAQLRSQAGDSIELQEAEQRGYARGAAEAERLRVALGRVRGRLIKTCQDNDLMTDEDAEAIAEADEAFQHDAPCETCGGDSKVCAEVPSLRHCEKANRSVQQKTTIKEGE